MGALTSYAYQVRHYVMKSFLLCGSPSARALRSGLALAVLAAAGSRLIPIALTGRWDFAPRFAAKASRQRLDLDPVMVQAESRAMEGTLSFDFVFAQMPLFYLYCYHDQCL